MGALVPQPEESPPQASLRAERLASIASTSLLIVLSQLFTDSLSE